jgi:hypothetical protein
MCLNENMKLNFIRSLVTLFFLTLMGFVFVKSATAADYIGPNTENCPGEGFGSGPEPIQKYMMIEYPISTSAKSISIQAHASLNDNVRKVFYQFYDKNGNNLLDSSLKLVDAPLSGIYYFDPAFGDGMTATDTGNSFSDVYGFNSFMADGSLVNKTYRLGTPPNYSIGTNLLPYGQQSILENFDLTPTPVYYDPVRIQPNSNYIFLTTAYNYVNESDRIDERKCVRTKSYVISTDIADVYHSEPTNDGFKVTVDNFPSEVVNIEYKLCLSRPLTSCTAADWENLGEISSNKIIKTFTGLNPNRIYALNLRFKNNDGEVIEIENQKGRGVGSESVNDGRGGAYTLTRLAEFSSANQEYVSFDVATQGEVVSTVPLGSYSTSNEFIKQFYINEFLIKGDGLPNYVSDWREGSYGSDDDIGDGVYDFSGTLEDRDCWVLLTCDIDRTYNPPAGYAKKFIPQVFLKYKNGILSGVNFHIKSIYPEPSINDDLLSPDTTFKLSFYVGKKIPNFVFTNAQVDNFSYEVGAGLNKLVTIEAKPISTLSDVALADVNTCSSEVADNQKYGVIKGDLITGSDNSPLKSAWIATNAACKQEPYWDGDQIVVKVGGPHYMLGGTTLNSGYFKAGISSATLSAWGISQAQAINSGLELLVSKPGITNSSANITTVSDGAGGIIVTANDLTYSFPELKLGKKNTSSGGSGGSSGSTQIIASNTPFVFSNPLKIKDSYFKSLSASQIGSISVAQFAKLPAKTIALISPSQAKALTFDQLKALKPSQVVALKTSVIAVLDSTQIAALQPADFRLMKTTQIARISAEAAAGLAKSDLNAFTQTQLRSLTTSAVKNLEPDVLKSLSINKLRQFSPRQIRSLTDEQKSILTKTQKNALRIK